MADACIAREIHMASSWSGMVSRRRMVRAETAANSKVSWKY